MKRLQAVRRVLAIGIAAIALVAPAAANESNSRDTGRGEPREIIIGEADILEELIEMDAEDIADLRADLADIRAGIEDAIGDIAEAREEMRDAPGGRYLVKIAFAAMAEATESAVGEAISAAFAKLDVAERGLADADVSDAERRETQGAIDGLRDDLGALEDALDDLRAALED
jgi:predicted  nucleic acid-binding Zn-ribbon protein